MCLSVLSQSGNCAASRAAFSSSTSVSDLTQKFKLFWQGLCEEVPFQVLDRFSAFYSEYRDEIRAAGVSFNEPHDMPGAYILVGTPTAAHGSPIALTFDSTSFTPPKVFIIGPAVVTATGKVSVHCDHPDAHVTLRDHTRATIRRGTAECHDWSVCSCGDDAHVTCYDSSTIYATSKTDITDRGHLRIYR